MQQFYYTYDKNGINLKQYIYTVGSYHLNWHRELELMTILNGEVEVCSEGVCRVLKEDDVIIFNSNKGHVTFAKKPDSIVMLLHIDPEFLRNYSKNGSYLNFDCCSNNKSRDEKQFRLIRSYLSEMILCGNKETIGQRLYFESTYYALLYTIVSYFQPKEIPATVYLHNEDRIDAISKMLRYIDKNYMQKITLNDLSQLSQYDRNYISQLFKAQLGINFHDYLTRIRLRNATLELKTDKNISDIALNNGFSDTKAFNRAFKSNFQKTPTEYRMQLNDNIIEIDTRFKKEFIPFDDKKINMKLSQYLVDKNECYLNNDCDYKLNYMNISESAQLLSEIHIKFKEMTNELKQATDDLGKNKLNISKSSFLPHSKY